MTAGKMTPTKHIFKKKFSRSFFSLNFWDLTNTTSDKKLRYLRYLIENIFLAYFILHRWYKWFFMLKNQNHSKIVNIKKNQFWHIFCDHLRLRQIKQKRLNTSSQIMPIKKFFYSLWLCLTLNGDRLCCCK